MSKGMLGLELDAPYRLGPIQVTELSLGLSGIRFPVDLSGGVPRFRHRRGVLHHLAAEVLADDLARWAAPALRGVFAETSPSLSVAPIEGGAWIGIATGNQALAFDVLVAPLEGDLRLLPERARGLGLGVPPHALALRILSAIAAPHGRAVRGAIILPRATAQIARWLLPDAGARAPSVAEVRWEAPELLAPEGVAQGLSLVANLGAPPPALPDRVVSALELAELAGDADIASFEGNLDTARRRYLSALERAPRHLEASMRLAWLDAMAGNRPEAALSTLVDVIPAAFAGILGGELLEAVGDRDGARVAFARAAEIEPYATLSALIWGRVATLADRLDDRIEALDRAIARAPGLASARWARLEARLDLADPSRAKADAEHLEAAALGAEARHEVWRRAAEAFLARGFLADAGALFERALRYAPSDPILVTGLGRSLRAAGQSRRALDVFARAVAVAEASGQRATAAELELSRCLVEVSGDRPAGIARASAIPPGLPESTEARFLEGQWRAELGDLPGAALAFGRMRAAVELALPTDPDHAARVAAMLSEAATMEEQERGDPLAARLSLGLALRLRPRDKTLAARFRKLSTAIPTDEKVAARSPELPKVPADEQEDVVEGGTEVRPEGAARSQASERIGVQEASTAPPAGEGASPLPELEALVDELTARLRAQPNDRETVRALAQALTQLGRDLDLLALLSARIEEGAEDERREIAPMRKEVLLRLASTARAEGRRSEADLYEMMANAEH